MHLFPKIESTYLVKKKNVVIQCFSKFIAVVHRFIKF